MSETSYQEHDSSVDVDLEYFADALATLFDDIPVSHGEPGRPFFYETESWGSIALQLTVTESWEEQLKFSHFIWRAELTLAKAIETGEIDLRGRRVLELGSGAGLCGILANFAGAAEVVLSDYPAKSMLRTLQHNVTSNLSDLHRKGTEVVGHIWGEDTNPLLQAGLLRGPFDVILLADCLWMPEQHVALCQTLTTTLKKSTAARIHCFAGFHTGRKNMANFFSVAEGYGISAVSKIREVNNKGIGRMWDPLRAEEDSVERKKWLVMADLAWKDK